MHTIVAQHPIAPLALALLLLVAGCDNAQHPTVTIAGAASMAEVLLSLDTIAGSAGTGPHITVTSGASNVLARAIREGAPYDILVSLDPAIVAELGRDGFLDPTTTREIARNRLVVASKVVPDTIYTSFDFLYNARRIAIGSEGVPLRTYTEQALRRAGVWDSLLPRFVHGADARQVAEMVRNGDVDAGILYASDAQQRRLGVLYAIPGELHRPVRIVAAATTLGAQRSEVQQTMNLLLGHGVRERLVQRGFTVAAPQDR